MSQDQFQYALLQYRHLRREEGLTVGVLVLFPRDKQVRFLFPHRLGRLRAAFAEAPEKLLHAWLKGFDWQARELNKKPEIFAAYDLEHQGDHFIAEYFLPPDSSALQFNSLKTSVLYHEDPSVISKNLATLYLGVYETDEDDQGQKDESWLAGQYRKFLREKNAEILRQKVQENYTAHFQDRQFKFDFAWQNGTLNLVKTVSLDLRREESIQRKGVQYFGQFMLLDGYAKEKHARFDVLLAKPEPRRLFRAYEKAVEDIRRAGNVEIIEAERLPEYAERTVQELLYSKG